MGVFVVYKVVYIVGCSLSRLKNAHVTTDIVRKSILPSMVPGLKIYGFNYRNTMSVIKTPVVLWY